MLTLSMMCSFRSNFSIPYLSSIKGLHVVITMELATIHFLKDNE